MMLTTAVESDPNFVPYEHIERVYKSSECRTPLVVFTDDGNPLPSIQSVAARQRLAVWSIIMDTPKNEQNALDYLEVGLQNGDWVYLIVTPQTSSGTLRQIAITLMTIQPEPKLFPKRELFRLWIALEHHYDLNVHINPILPTVMTKNAIVGMKTNSVLPSSPTNSALRKRMPAEPTLFVQEVQKQVKRKEKGKEEDSASDTEEPMEKPTGMWFHRSADLFIADATNVVTKGKDDIFDAVEKQDISRLTEILTKAKESGSPIDLNETFRKGHNPLHLAVMMNSLSVVEVLLNEGADPNVPTLGPKTPPLFMSIDTVEMFLLLVKFGADLDGTYEGRRLVNHPDTSPDIIKYIKEHPDL
eukprot:PhF_6_TR2246/c0_g1_i1/m.3831